MTATWSAYRRPSEDLARLGPGVAMRFKRTASVVQRCQNQRKRCSRGRETGVGARAGGSTETPSGGAAVVEGGSGPRRGVPRGHFESDRTRGTRRRRSRGAAGDLAAPPAICVERGRRYVADRAAAYRFPGRRYFAAHADELPCARSGRRQRSNAAKIIQDGLRLVRYEVDAGTRRSATPSWPSTARPSTTRSSRSSARSTRSSRAAASAASATSRAARPRARENRAPSPRHLRLALSARLVQSHLHLVSTPLYVVSSPTPKYHMVTHSVVPSESSGISTSGHGGVESRAHTSQ